VFRLEYGADRRDLELRRDGWAAVYDGTTGRPNRSFFEQMVRTRDRPGALAILRPQPTADSFAPVILQGFAHALARPKGPTHTVAFAARGYFLLFKEGVDAVSMEHRIRPITNDGLVVTDGRDETLVRVAQALTNVVQPQDIGDVVNACVQTLRGA
jgi:hypothetical protein